MILHLQMLLLSSLNVNSTAFQQTPLMKNPSDSCLTEFGKEIGQQSRKKLDAFAACQKHYWENRQSISVPSSLQTPRTYQVCVNRQADEGVCVILTLKSLRQARIFPDVTLICHYSVYGVQLHLSLTL